MALLFLRDPETAREVNDATSLIRHNINGVLANRLVMRIGNCAARATFNENENAVMLDLTATVGMRRCQRMLSALLARRVQEGEGEDDDISQAKPLRPSGGAPGRARGADRRAGAPGAREPGEQRQRRTRGRAGGGGGRRWAARAEVTEEEKPAGGGGRGRARGYRPPAICAAAASRDRDALFRRARDVERREEAKDGGGAKINRLLAGRREAKEPRASAALYYGF